jgi:Na+-translocating ferredoxin:NAD+ oxidoreductase RnfG subunit
MKKTMYFAFFLSATAMIVTLVTYVGYTLTAPIIEQNRIDKINNNIAILFDPEEGYIRNPEQKENSYQEKRYKGLSEVYEVLNSDGEIHALIYNLTSQGRNGPVQVLIAVDPYTDVVMAVTFYNHIETPNIGEKYTRDDFILGDEKLNYQGLVGQSVDYVDVDVIAGASTTWIAVRDMFDILTVHYEEQEVHIDG